MKHYFRKKTFNVSSCIGFVCVFIVLAAIGGFIGYKLVRRGRICGVICDNLNQDDMQDGEQYQ